MQQPDIAGFANAFASNGVLTIRNLLPEALATSVEQELAALDWVLQVKDYGQASRLEIPLSDIANRDNLVAVLYDRKHDIDLDKLFYIRLAAAYEDLKSDALVRTTEFLNSENFIQACRQIVQMPDITHTWLEATCYDKGCFLANHRDDHHADNRVALVLNLTRTWKLDWGGLLMLETRPDAQPVIVPPLWNSLSLFRIPVNHTVTAVSQAATEHRYSLTGWLRG
jgi:Rps23 Pro-64 3,4-dihydroxylase Tpa1-like proline 4-hydroxylase